MDFIDLHISSCASAELVIHHIFFVSCSEETDSLTSHRGNLLCVSQLKYSFLSETHKMRLIDVFSARPHWIVCGLSSVGKSPLSSTLLQQLPLLGTVTNVSSIALKRTCLLN